MNGNSDVMERFDELREAAKPLVEFLNKYYGPMSKAIVTEGNVEVVINAIGISLEVRD